VEKLSILEQQIYIEIKNKVSEMCDDYLKIAEIIAEIDLISNFGYISREYQYIKPTLLNTKDRNSVIIQNGRHPVVEKLVEHFTPNSTKFNKDEFIHILTGPNMSGKSTYIRQVALITLIAQIGCFVPVDKMQWNIVDRIFTRVGASDNLSKGESTFMVEMSETANILNNSTMNSLIVLDEVGRGTSTYDGVAIAWSILEYIHSNIKCNTLFATHYHELIDLEKKYQGIKNYNVEVLDDNGEILFKHRILPGGTNQSYGVHVAKIAGIPMQIINRANLILTEFENKNINPPLSTQRGLLKDQANLNILPRPKKINPEQLGLI